MPNHRLAAAVAIVFLCAAAGSLVPNARADEFVAVYSKVSNGYQRSRLPDGTILPESYALKEGGYLSGRMADDTIDKMTFDSVAHTIAGPLAERRYLAAVDPKDAKLLIVVFWGTTRAPAETSPSTSIGQQMQRDVPDKPRAPRSHVMTKNEEGWLSLAARGLVFSDKIINEEDATMLGYGSASDPDLRTYRYFVVLLAYDLQALLRDKKQTLLWETRFSMNEHHNQFEVQLKPMVQEASLYFGRDSQGLRHDPVPEGHVEIGEVKSLGAGPDMSGLAVLSPDGARVAYVTKKGDALDLALADVDRMDFHWACEIPDLGGQQAQLAWFDARVVLLRLPSGELLAFDATGKRVDFDPRVVGPSFAGLSRGAPSVDLSEKIDSIAEGKLPGRRVTVLGTDVAQRRFLLTAVDPSKVGRIFVYDGASDLLFEVGRSVPPHETAVERAPRPGSGLRRMAEGGQRERCRRAPAVSCGGGSGQHEDGPDGLDLLQGWRVRDPFRMSRGRDRAVYPKPARPKVGPGPFHTRWTPPSDYAANHPDPFPKIAEDPGGRADCEGG